MFDEQSFALLEDSKGRLVQGIGPFIESSFPSEEGVSFYLNDFNLSNEKPWLIPSDFVVLDTEDSFFKTESYHGELEWIDPEIDLFSEQFNSIKDSMSSTELLKTVPVTVSKSKINNFSSIFPKIIKNGVKVNGPSHFYAYRNSSYGFAGLSPEILFEINDNKLRTMALAGTTQSDELESFINDQKEINEHQIVVDSLRRRLSEFGTIVESERKTLNLGGITHFLTEFEVTLGEFPSISHILKQIHPTPAIGTVPRNKNTLNSLNLLRKKSESPSMFAAPFGVKIDRDFISYIMIRGVFLDENTISLPTGCGITTNSNLHSEWDELALKRLWVKDAFGLNL